VIEPWRELLKYPNPEGLHPVEAAWRDHCRELLSEFKSLPSQGAWNEAARMLREADQARRKAEAKLAAAHERLKRWETQDIHEAMDCHRKNEEFERLEHALRFYADPKRYEGSNQSLQEDDPYTPRGFPFLIDIHRDGGAIARAALEQP